MNEDHPMTCITEYKFLSADIFLPLQIDYILFKLAV
jgi:hypothetical protein